MQIAMEGGCACGKVRYRLQSTPMFVHCCHCKDCQRQTGTAFVLNAIVSVVLTLIFRALRVPDGRDRTTHADYGADGGDPKVTPVLEPFEPSIDR